MGYRKRPKLSSKKCREAINSICSQLKGKSKARATQEQKEVLEGQGRRVTKVILAKLG